MQLEQLNLEKIKNNNEKYDAFEAYKEEIDKKFVK